MDKANASVSCEFISSEDCTDILSQLPTREGWSFPPLLYKNYWLNSYFVQNIMRVQYCFKPRHDDIILATNPKCGNTWLKSLAFAITNRSIYDFDGHPLLFRHPQEVVRFIEIPLDEDITYVETLPSPRILATHMPLSLFPESINGCGCRFVYICRDPKDAFISRWHFDNKLFPNQKTDLESAFNMFYEGISDYGPFWDHCLEYWRESIARPDRVLFLKYEEMMVEPVKHVVRLASFLGIPFTRQEEEDGVPEKVVRLCSFEKLSSLQSNQKGEIMRKGNFILHKSVYFRRAKVGDWVNDMSPEMGSKLDQVVEEKLKGSGLVL